MGFTIIGRIEDVEVIAIGSAIRELERLRKIYGPGRWRKLKGRARVQFADGSELMAELHWYEAHGVGKKDLKIKQILDDL